MLRIERNISGKQAREFTAEMNGRACYSMPEACPFCKQTAEFRSDERGDIDTDCLNWLIEVTSTRPAVATECRSSERTLEYIRG